MPNSEIVLLKNMLKSAIQEFYQKDNELISEKGMEQACVFRIGLYLHEKMKTFDFCSDLNLDCEYNKSNRGPKMLDDMNVRPDLIIHKRNLNNIVVNDRNMLIVEFKGWWNSNQNDIDKLTKFTSLQYGYCYPLGIFVKLGKSENKIQYKYFRNGREVSENDL